MTPTEPSPATAAPADSPAPPGVGLLDPISGLDAYLEAFERAAGRDAGADLAAYLPGEDHPLYLPVLRELVRVDLEFAWDRGERRLVEGYRDRFPRLLADPAGFAEVRAEERRLRRAAGEEADPREYRARFGVNLGGGPGAGAGASVGPTQTRRVPGLAGGDWPPDREPAVGDTVPPGLRLLEELGRGAFGRVFLARQEGLADRPVAVKLSTRLLGESQTLARLQHANIVPVYSAHLAAGRQAIVMPYLGRTTLADLLDSFRAAGEAPLTGKSVVDTLTGRAAPTLTGPSSRRAAPTAGPASADCSAAPPEEAPGPDPALPDVPIPGADVTLAALARFSFVEAVLWLGAELADGLAHAHERGILHRDLKPANVLVTDEGRPMLLDFNLAAEALPGDGPLRGEVCGTVRYMAPEQLEGVQRGVGVFSPRTDLYALGLMLYELLAGRLPDPVGAGTASAVVPRLTEARMRTPAPVSHFRADASPAVSAILARCLAPDPGQRYAGAAQLREDLRRQLAHEPLRHAPDRSPRERLAKWARRHPRLSSSLSLGVLALAAVAGLAVALVAGRQRSLALEAGRALHELRRTRDEMQGAGLVGRPPAEELEALRGAARGALAPFRAEEEDWPASAVLGRLAGAEREEARRLAGEVLFRASEASARLAELAPDAGREALRAEARVFNARALAGWPGEAPAPFRAQAARLEGGSPAVAAAGEGQSREELLRRAREGAPSYGAWMAVAEAAWREGKPGASIEPLTAALALSPRSPWPLFHRGLAHLEEGRYADAEGDLDRFLARVPDCAAGRVNRALCRFHRKDYPGCLADLDAAAGGTGPGPAEVATRVHALRERVLRLQGDEAGARRARAALLASTPRDAVGWTVLAEARLAGSPGAGADAGGAVGDFDRALALEPTHAPALRGKASALAERLGRPGEAVAVLARLVEAGRGTAEDRAGRAVLLARLGRKGEARAEAARVAGEADGPASAVALYQAASAYLAGPGGPGDVDEGLRLLRRCLLRGPEWARHMPADPDLAVLREDPRLAELVRATRLLLGEPVR